MKPTMDEAIIIAKKAVAVKRAIENKEITETYYLNNMDKYFDKTELQHLEGMIGGARNILTKDMEYFCKDAGE